MLPGTARVCNSAVLRCRSGEWCVRPTVVRDEKTLGVPPAPAQSYLLGRMAGVTLLRTGWRANRPA